VGVRTFNDKELEENLIEYSARNSNFINVLVRMPGFTPSSKVAQKVAGMLQSKGLDLKKNDRFNPKRKAIPRIRFLSDQERQQLIAQDSRYGRVICKCETVTEGEIIEAVHRGANTLQGVMFRTRAGMGRCQRNWCGPKILEIMAGASGVQKKEVTFKGKGFQLITN
jgi:glycerol-3-phosphate dehydrogenase